MLPYNPQARLSAFIFVENNLYLAKTHTECIIQLLIEKELVKNETHFYKLLNSEKTKDQIESWSSQIENCSIFGELAFYDKKLTLFLFDKVTEYGLEKIKECTFNKYGEIDIYQAKYDINYENHYCLIKLN